MRILWFVNIPFPEVRKHLGLPISGSGWWMISLARALAACNGVDLAITWASPQFEEVVRIKAGKILFYCIPEEKYADLRFRNPIALKGCKSVITEFRPNIIEVHGTERYYGLVSKSIETPLVISLQGILSRLWKVCHGGLSFLETLRLRGVLLTCLSYRMRVCQEQKIIASNSYFIGRTEWDRKFVLSLNPSAKYYHCDEIIRNKFLTTVWSIKKRSVKPVIVLTSAAKPLKGVDIVLRALKIMSERGNETELHVLGEFPESGYGGWLRGLADELNISHLVDFKGYQEEDELINELAEAWIFILPSRLENSSNSLAEAQAFGLPVIASDAGGTSSLVQNGETGLLFRSEDCTDLANKIQAVLFNNSLVGHLSSGGRAEAVKRHNADSIVERRMNIYMSILQQ